MNKESSETNVSSEQNRRMMANSKVWKSDYIPQEKQEEGEERQKRNWNKRK